MLFFLCLPQWAQSAINIYRSVGPNNHLPIVFSTGGGGPNHLSISSGEANFNFALPLIVGVGDAIQYDTDFDGSIDAIAFIHSRLDSTRYIVANADGGSPLPATNTDVWQINRAYASLAEAESGSENPGIESLVRSFENWSDGKDLVASDQIWHIACYNDDVDSVSVTIDGWTTGPNHYLVIYAPSAQSEVGVSQRHHGTWTTSGYRIMADPMMTWAGVVFILDDHVRIHGLQVEAQGSDPDTDGITVDGNQVATSGDIRIAHNIVRKDSSNSNLALGIGAWGHGGMVGNNPTLRIWNNIVYNFDGSDNFGIFVGYYCSSTLYVYNNTVVNCTNGYVVDGQNAAPNFILKNNIAQNCTTGYFERLGGQFNTSLSDYNISDNATETTYLSPTYRPGLASTVVFEGPTNFHLASTDTMAMDNGQDLTSDIHIPLKLDIDLQSRPQGLQWDIGSDENDHSFTTPNPTPVTVPTPIVSPTPIIINATATNTSSPLPRSTSDLIISHNILRPGTDQAVHVELNLEHRQRIIIKIYNRRGKEICTLVDQTLNAGSNQFSWDGLNARKKMVGSGIFLIHVKGDKINKSHKIAVVR